MENNTEETPLPDIKVRENTEKSINEASVLFFQSMKKIRYSKLSRKKIIRAFDFAMNNTLTDRKVVLQSDTERQIAFLLGLVFDARLIMISKLYEDKQTNNKENKENEPNPQVS